MINGQNFLDQHVKNDLRKCDNIRKNATAQEEDDYTTGCLEGHLYFKQHYKMIATDLCKQQVLDADPKAIKQLI